MQRPQPVSAQLTPTAVVSAAGGAPVVMLNAHMGMLTQPQALLQQQQQQQRGSNYQGAPRQHQQLGRPAPLYGRRASLVPPPSKRPKRKEMVPPVERLTEDPKPRAPLNADEVQCECALQALPAVI